MIELCPTTPAQSRQHFAAKNNAGDCGGVATASTKPARKNPHLMHVVGESAEKIEQMYVLPNSTAKKRLVAAAALALLALFASWLGMREVAPQSARDFEECAEQVEVASPSSERAASVADCDSRFAGRRKAGGGYTYYDFMQNRHFDIMGANPTPEERKQIDYAYMGFLAAQRREAVSAELAERQNNQLRADLEKARQPVGPPMVLTPANLASTSARRPVERSTSKPCQDGSLSCSWEKFSAVVKNAFASSSKRQLNPAVSLD
jgi:hypothetical protein